MPMFAVHVLDKPHTLSLRLETAAAHRNFIELSGQFGVTIILSGPLQSDDGETMIGSLFIMEAASRAEVEAFTAADPYATAGLWGELQIHRFHRRKG